MFGLSQQTASAAVLKPQSTSTGSTLIQSRGMVKVTDATFATEVEAREGLVLVDFGATWCAPCRVLEPILDEIASQHAGLLRVAKIDIDENQRSVMRFNVRSAPTMIFFKGGTPVGQIVGAVPRARIEEAIARLS